MLRPARNGVDRLSQFLSHSSPSAAVRRRPPESCSGRSRTVTDAGERGPALVESVLGATPREFESRILRNADQGKHRSPVSPGWRFEARWSHLLVSVLSAQHHLHGVGRNCFARSQASRTALQGEQHAAEACALPFRAGQDRSPAAGYPPTNTASHWVIEKFWENVRRPAVMNGNSVASVGAYAAPERVDLCEATRVAAIVDRFDSPILPPTAAARHPAPAAAESLLV